MFDMMYIMIILLLLLFVCVRILTRLLEVSDDPQVIAVAAHDVGEYVRHYPRGKRYIFSLTFIIFIYSNVINTTCNTATKGGSAVILDPQNILIVLISFSFTSGSRCCPYR